MKKYTILIARTNSKCLMFLLFIFLLHNSALNGQKATFSEVLENAEQIDDVSKLYAIYNLDAIKYFDLEDSIDTELKRKAFKKTEDYGQYLNILKELKAGMNDKSYYFEYRQVFRDKPYDLKKGGFLFTISTNDVSDWMTSGMPKTINDIFFPSIHTIKYK
ncbi:MAG: hypothetical protein QME74_08835, partial [Candidatus Edwardsbacteria bacterium]|nr:hypothetical protein [Candidatus Edwardsbacteria bacterium]